MTQESEGPQTSAQPTAAAEFDLLVRRSAGPQPWRRLFHASVGVAAALILHFSLPSDALALTILAGVVALLLVMEGIRLKSPRFNVFFFRIFNRVITPAEKGHVVSSVWYAVGMFLVVAAFPREIAVPAILVVAVADPAASWVGRRWGRRRLGKGTATGTLTFVVAAIAVQMPLVAPGPAAFAAVVSGGVEVLPWKLNDNLTVPLAAGAALWLWSLV